MKQGGRGDAGFGGRSLGRACAEAPNALDLLAAAAEDYGSRPPRPARSGPAHPTPAYPPQSCLPCPLGAYPPLSPTRSLTLRLGWRVLRVGVEEARQGRQPRLPHLLPGAAGQIKGPEVCLGPRAAVGRPAAPACRGTRTPARQQPDIEMPGTCVRAALPHAGGASGRWSEQAAPCSPAAALPRRSNSQRSLSSIPPQRPPSLAGAPYMKSFPL